MERLNREKTMQQWDSWREYIANGGKASWPRDQFENLIDFYEKQIELYEEKQIGLENKMLNFRFLPAKITKN